MTIADTDAYGDSEYQASNGNIASSARYATFGSVFHSSVASMGADMTASVSMLDKKTTRPMTSFVASGNVDDGSPIARHASADGFERYRRGFLSDVMGHGR